MRYNNKFFAVKEEAMTFRKQHGGRLLHMTDRSSRETKLDFLAECAVALDARQEEIDPKKTPYCVAWTELN